MILFLIFYLSLFIFYLNLVIFAFLIWRYLLNIFWIFFADSFFKILILLDSNSYIFLFFNLRFIFYLDYHIKIIIKEFYFLLILVNPALYFNYLRNLNLFYARLIAVAESFSNLRFLMRNIKFWNFFLVIYTLKLNWIILALASLLVVTHLTLF